MSRLRPQCDNLKAERRKLIADVTQHTAEKASLTKEIELFQAERDSLRIEYTREREQNRWWTQHDLSSSATPNGGSEFDGQGKLNRKLWLVEQKNAELVKEITQMKRAHSDAIDVEMAVAAGLRDRIGVLEERVRKGRSEVEDAVKEKEEQQANLTSTTAKHETAQTRLQTECTDLRDALAKEKEKVARMSEQISRLSGDKERTGGTAKTRDAPET